MPEYAIPLRSEVPASHEGHQDILLGMIVRMGLLGRKGLELSVVGIEPSPHCSGVQASKRIGTIFRIRLLMKADAMRSSDDGSLLLAVIKKQVSQANSSRPIS
jgi:hypothetical protein